MASLIVSPYALYDWRELNDLWIAGVAVVGLSVEGDHVDGRFMRPFQFTLHDYGHASSVAQKTAFLSPLRIMKMLKNARAYKKFRQLQAKESDPRKRSLREGILFFMLHDSDTFPFKEPFLRLLNSFRTIIKNKFIKDSAEYGSSFEPEASHTEVNNEIDWFIKNFDWDKP